MTDWVKKTSEEKLAALREVNGILPDIKQKELVKTVVENKDADAYNETRMFILVTIDEWYEDETKKKIKELLK